jgi:hypothetical protein
MERALAFSESDLEDRREDKETLESLKGLIQERIRNAYIITERNYKLYEYFCDNVVTALLLEDIF